MFVTQIKPVETKRCNFDQKHFFVVQYVDKSFQSNIGSVLGQHDRDNPMTRTIQKTMTTTTTTTTRTTTIVMMIMMMIIIIIRTNTDRRIDKPDVSKLLEYHECLERY